MALITLIVLQIVLFVVALSVLNHYYTLPMPGMEVFPTMAVPSSDPPVDIEALSTPPVDIKTPETHYIWNVSLYFVFWAQHILMATLKYKLKWLSSSKYFPLYDRYIYNVASGITILAMVYNLKPTHIPILYTIPAYICIPLSLLGFYLFAAAMYTFRRLIFLPYSPSAILNSTQLQIIPY